MEELKHFTHDHPLSLAYLNPNRKSGNIEEEEDEEDRDEDNFYEEENHGRQCNMGLLLKLLQVVEVMAMTNGYTIDGAIDRLNKLLSGLYFITSLFVAYYETLYKMTTSVGNNSVFRSFFEKQRLTGPNFIDWYRQLPHAAWVKGQKEVVVLMLLTMDLEIQRNLAHLGAYDMLQELKAMFSKQAEQELLQTVREFHTCKQEEGQSVSSHGNTVNELHAMLKLHEDSLPKKDANPALHAIRAGRVQKNQKNKPHKAAKGGHGKGKGKMGYAPNNAPFAPKPKTPPSPKKDNPQQRNAILPTNGLRGSKMLKPGALSLYVGDGHRTAVEAIGTYHVELPSGLVIVLNNCHYAPSITRVSKKNLVYFMAFPRDGIFEIDMSCSNTNDSSMYAISNKRAKINLDSSLLWHCRLGHISKKRIEKLQHDGLLNSIDIERRSNPSLDTSLNHEEDDQEINETKSDINPIRRSTRTRRPTDRLCLYIDTEEHKLRDLGEPANYKAALLNHNSEILNAMKCGMQSMKDNDVWVLVELPPNARTVGSKWLFKKRIDMDGAIHTFKAHLVAKGFTQTYGVDYEKPFLRSDI
ncbi:zinc finger, CCHC-type containing protein [Tanacetum coccineum]